jgi:eukaryotic-like serine/threonine-protein kinase
MTPERWREVKDLFDHAMERLPGERAALIERERRRDPELAREAEQLLAANAAAGDFLETPAVEQIVLPAESPRVPAHIGPYDVERELGHGGMGTVYLAARSQDGFRQTAALKLVRRGMDSEFILERFRGERQILAGLDHSGIARLLDGGSTAEGLPYFVMEYIPGRHLLEDAAARRLSLRERIGLFLEVCEAVAYAHRHLVVHRDIKPSNILVTPEGVPKLLDFGLAKLLRPDGPAEGRTETALRLLTPDYASPEQVRGERVTTATDIYSLGVVLYELATGRRPYRMAGQSPEAIARAVCEEEPARPGLSKDFDNIVVMALRKQPERRYPSVEALAEDLRRQLDGRPVLARKDTLGYRAGRFVARHRMGTVAAALGALALAGALATAISQARIARAERAEAESRFDDVRRLANSFLFEFHDSIKDLPGSTPARELVVRRALEYLEKLSSVRHDDAELQRELAEAYERVARVQGGLFESHLGDTEGARKSLLRAIAIREQLARAGGAANDREALAETELQLSQVLMTAGDASGAAARARRAATALEALSAAKPLDRRLEARRARAHRYVGAALVRSSARAQALTELTAAERSFDALAASEPDTKAFRRELAITNQLIVHALGGGHERERALRSYTKAVALQSELVAAEPGNSSYARELAYSHVSMGAFYEWSGDEKSALETYARALPILESLVATDPRNADTRLLLAETCNSVGYAQVAAGALAAGLANLERSRALLEPIAAADPANVRATLALARLYESFGTARAGDRVRALGWFRKSVEAYGALRSRGALDPQAAAELDAVVAKIAAVSTAG